MVSLGNLFGKKETSVLGIDIGSSSIKIVQIRKQSGQAVLETYGELALGPYGNATIGQSVALPFERISQALIDLMNEKEVNVTTKACGIALPFGTSLMSVIEMPAVGNKQLALMVPLEARKYIPVPISEVALDWSIVPKNEIRNDIDMPDDSPKPVKEVAKTPAVPKIDVLVVAIHKETINRYQELVQKSGLDASFFEIEIFSTMRAVLDESVKPVMIMDMGSASTKLYIVERGVVRSSHTVNRGAQDVTITISKSLGISIQEAEIMKRKSGLTGVEPMLKEVIVLALDYIFAEANRVLLAFEKRYSRTVAKVILVGGGAALAGLPDLAKSNFKCEAVAGNPFVKLTTPAFIEDVLRTTGPEFAVAVGVALRRLSEV